VAIGARALYLNDEKSNLVAVGDSALYNNGTGATTNSEAYGNTAIGSKSLYYNTTGAANTALGERALYNNTTGYWNTAVGRYAFFNGNYINSTALGEAVDITGNNQVRVGNSLVTSIGGPVGWTNLSDGRFKTDVQENVPGIEFIKKLRPVTYRLQIDKLNKYKKMPDEIMNDPLAKDFTKNAEAQLHTGFIAQEVESAANAVHYNFSGVDKPQNENDVYGLRYAEFVVPLVKTLQEQQKLIEDLQRENDALKAKLEKIENLLNSKK